MKAFELETRLIDFASRIMDMAEALPQTFAAKHLGTALIIENNELISIFLASNKTITTRKPNRKS